MNSTTILRFFTFIENKIGENTPLSFKILHFPESITEKDLNVKGSLVLDERQVKTLPNGLTVGRTLNLTGTPMTHLPARLTVDKHLVIVDTQITALPKDLRVGGYVIVSWDAEKYFTKYRNKYKILHQH